MGLNKTHMIYLLMLVVGMLLVFVYMGRGGDEVHVYREQAGSVPSGVGGEAGSGTGGGALGRYGSQDLYYNVAKVVQQRNNISRQLNLRQQQIGQKECEHAGRGVAASGGWCAKDSVENSGEHRTDKDLVPVLAKFLKGKKVGSFGDGPGRYKQLMLDTGLLKGYDAYDGAPFSEKTSEGRVTYLDLTLPQYGLPLYDWVLTLEVAEHIPKQFEHIYIDNIIRHAKEGVILSWAVPGQTGHSHVNEQPFAHVKQVFDSHGFEHDAESSTLLQKACSLGWLQKNTNVFKRKDMSKIDLLETFYT